jgi:cytochrome P450
MPYGDEWRAQRRVFQQYLGPRRINRQLERNERMLRFVRRGLLPNLFTSPKDFREHLKKSVAYIISCYISNSDLLIPIVVLAALPCR